MLHKIFAPGPWFAPRRPGPGAGWPIAWQGLALVVSFFGLIAGAARFAGSGESGAQGTALALVGAGTAVFVLVARNRTRVERSRMGGIYRSREFS